MRARSGAMVVGVMMLVANSSAHALELLVNGSLDLTVPYNPDPLDLTSLAPQPANWTVVGSRTLGGAFTDVLSSESFAGPGPTPETTEGTGLSYFTGMGCNGPDCGGFFKPFRGSLVTGDLATGHLRQTIIATPGTHYELTAWAGAESQYSGRILGSPTRTELAIAFLGAGFVLLESAAVDLEALGLGDPNGEPYGYKQFSVSGIAPAGTLFARARFSMIDAYANPAGGGQALVVDDFSMRSIPEPATVVTLGIMALGIAGGLAFSRRACS